MGKFVYILCLSIFATVILLFLWIQLHVLFA